MTDLTNHFSVAQAIALLLAPHVEVVIHDLKTGKIGAIYNSFSKRKVGDESLLDTLGEELPDVFPVYLKSNWDGRKLKSCTATLRDKKGSAIGLLCINLDLTKWEELHQFLGSWIGTVSMEQPEVLFKDDWREKINTYVADYLRKEGITLKVMTKEKKRELVGILHREGAFKAKNAASYIADVLELSRATIYNYLRSL